MFHLIKRLNEMVKIVVLGDGFCVLQVLVDFKNKGVHGDAILEKR